MVADREKGHPIQIRTSGSSRKALNWENAPSGVLRKELAATEREKEHVQISHESSSYVCAYRDYNRLIRN